MRRWALQADIGAGARPGVSTEESAEINRLKAVNRLLSEDLEIMRRASIYVAGELDPRNRVFVVLRASRIGSGRRSLVDALDAVGAIVILLQT